MFTYSTNVSLKLAENVECVILFPRILPIVSVLGENGKRILALSAKTAKGIQRCRRQRQKNFSVFGDNGERISPLSAKTAKEFQRIRRQL